VKERIYTAEEVRRICVKCYRAGYNGPLDLADHVVDEIMDRETPQGGDGQTRRHTYTLSNQHPPSTGPSPILSFPSGMVCYGSQPMWSEYEADCVHASGNFANQIDL
jgi:hypothetical protein